MSRRLTIPLLGLLVGVGLGLLFRLELPTVYARYLAVAVMAALDSGLGGLRAALERSFSARLLVTGFIATTLLAALITFVGERLGANLYLAAVVALGVRMFQNLAVVRRLVLK